MNALIIAACFLPLAIIFLIMKLAVWFTAVNNEQTYVREDAKRPHGPYLANPYEDLDEEDDWD